MPGAAAPGPPAAGSDGGHAPRGGSDPYRVTVSRRGWAVVVGIGVLATAAVGLVGDYLLSQERRPLWVWVTLIALVVVCVVAAVALWLADDSGAAAVPPLPAAIDASPESSVVHGNENVVANAGGIALGSGATLSLHSGREPAAPLPRPRVDLCLGRDAEVARVAGAWSAGRSAAVLGAPGIGKSTVLAYALEHASLGAAYGPRRFVVPCEGAESADAAVDKMANVLGVPLGDHLRNQVVSFLVESPCVLVLDNFESVTDGDPAGAAGLVATLLTADSPVALGIGYRGAALSPGLSGLDTVALGPLDLDDAVDVFVATAGRGERADGELRGLVADLDGVPLAITLLGALARTEAVGALATAWRAKRTDLLRHGANPDRTSSVPVSIELSWERLSGDAREALSLAALLPDGWPQEAPDTYLPDRYAAAVIELRNRALLHDEAGRRRCLAPIRQHVLAHHPPRDDHRQELLTRVRTLAERCWQVGTPEGAAVVAAMAAEFTNLVDVIRAGLQADPDLATVVSAVLEFQRFTGLGDDQLGLDAIALSPSPAVTAANAFALGLLYIDRSENMRARELFGRALPLYRRIDEPLGEANCLSNLGQLSFRESDHKHARELFGQALPLYRRVGDALGEANCLRTLGELAFRESDHEHARALFGQALPLYRRVGAVLGEANCLSCLGELAFRESDNEHARALYGEALPLYQRIGAVLGEANCLHNLGELALHESDHDHARELFGQALPLYRRVGNALGEANCLHNLGELALHESDHDRARELFGQALPLYQRVRDRYSQAMTHAWLARLSTGAERSAHCAALDELAATLELPGFRDSLRSISGC